MKLSEWVNNWYIGVSIKAKIIEGEAVRKQLRWYHHGLQISKGYCFFKKEENLH